MDREIPIYFDSVIIESPFQEVSQTNPNVGRLKVRVFTKYGNRNGSYITDAVADQLIESACQGNTPVVGFFDPGTQTWASHSGPKLANAYGYVENFIGWQPFEDTDGVTREYAVFSIILFTDYFSEAQKVLGQNQSMELDPSSIEGDWTMIDNEEYFVYTAAKMLGFCIIGEHEPCFSVSSFFAKNDDAYTTQYEKFSSMLSALKTQVEELTMNRGEKPMDELKQPDVVVEEENIESEVETEPAQDFSATAVETDQNQEVHTEAEEQPSNFELLQQQYDELQASFDDLQNRYNEAQTRIQELEQFQTNATTELETLRTTNEELQASLQNYENQMIEVDTEKKTVLLNKYELLLNEAEIDEIRTHLNDYTYEALEAKLAILFANAKMAETETQKVPLAEPHETQFALLMKKYRKN